MKQHCRPVLVVDDDPDDLCRAVRAYPNALTWNPAQPDGRTPTEAVEYAIGLLQEHRPSTVILDLQWHNGATFFDGIRFLQRACDEDLLAGVHLIIWSKFLTAADRKLASVLSVAATVGVQSIARVTKEEVPRLDEVWS